MGEGECGPMSELPLGTSTPPSALEPTAPSTVLDANTPDHELTAENVVPGLHYWMESVQIPCHGPF